MSTESVISEVANWSSHAIEILLSEECLSDELRDILSYELLLRDRNNSSIDPQWGEEIIKPPSTENTQ